MHMLAVPSALLILSSSFALCAAVVCDVAPNSVCRAVSEVWDLRRRDPGHKRKQSV